MLIPTDGQVAKFRHTVGHMFVEVAYAQTNEASDTNKDGFYWELDYDACRKELTYSGCRRF